MSLIKWVLGESRLNPLENPNVPANWQALYDVMVGSSPSNVRKVTPEEAMRISTVYACVRVLAETVATLPLVLYKRREGRQGKDRAYEHPLFWVLHDLPYDDLTSVEMWEMMVGHLAFRGRAFAEILYDGAGRKRGLFPFHPDRVTLRRNARNELVYDLALPDGRTATLRRDRVLHLRGISSDGYQAYSPIGLFAQTFGYARSLDDYNSTFFGNSARPSGVLETDEEISPEAASRLRIDWEGMHKGEQNAHRVAILESGLKWKDIGITPKEAEFVLTKKLSRTEICSIFRVPPHMVQDLERATFSNIEHQSIEFVTHTIRPYLVRIEKAIHRDLFSEEERRQYVAEFVVDGLLRGDAKARAEALQIQRQNGIINADEWREIENRNPIEDPDQPNAGKMYLVNGSMIRPDSLLVEPEPEEDAEGEEDAEDEDAEDEESENDDTSDE